MFKIAIVGRPNVGKSALFNRLIGRRIAIVHDQPGVTRDRLAAPCAFTEDPCELIDTGGIGEDADLDFSEAVRAEVELAVASADLIFFVVDIRSGLTLVDEELAHRLRQAGKPIELLLNKADEAQIDSLGSEFARLGMGSGLPVSAEHGRNFQALVSILQKHAATHVEEKQKAKTRIQKEGLKIAIVGRPNAGKSSLVNAILHDKRAIVSDLAGTTRDSIDIPYEYNGERHLLIDTAGLRARSKMDSSVEIFSAQRAQRSIRRADLCVLVIDIAAGVTAQDRKIARYITLESKPCIIIANKYDLFHPGAPKSSRLEEISEHLRTELFFLSYAPFVSLSALTGQSVSRIFSVVDKVRSAAQETPGTGALNRLFQEAFLRNPPGQHKKHKRRLKMFYATAAVNERYKAIPVPEYILFVNDKRLLTKTYSQYLENRLREKYPSLGLPINFSPRSRRDLKD